MIKKITNLSIYLLRYLSIISTKYKVSNKISFGSNLSNDFFKKNLKKCKFYFEYGAGSSTLLANKLHKKFISIESDKSFYKYLKNKKKIKNLRYLDIGPTKYFSHPILPHFIIKKKIYLYSNYINFIFLNTKEIPDFILIDGRFRVSTCMYILNFLLKKKIKKKIIIILDDYINRENYKILEKVVQVIKIGRFGVITYNHFRHFSKSKIKNILLKTEKDIM